jgi:hypothetical protein
MTIRRLAIARLSIAIALLFVPACGGDGITHRDGSLPPVDSGATADDASSLGDGSVPPTDAGAIPACLPTTACDEPLPDLGATVEWRNPAATGFTVSMGRPHHHGRDLYLREGDPQWALAKFTYGTAHDDLKGEDVDIYLLRNCGTSWEHLGTATTTTDEEHETVEGVLDTGGRVYFEIPAAQRLGIGRHRLAFVVKGDHTVATQFIEVLPSGARFVVSDVDGTQTESEAAEAEYLLLNAIFLGDNRPAARPYGPELLWAFANRGYRIFYVTARPEWLHVRTHEWVFDDVYQTC